MSLYLNEETKQYNKVYVNLSSYAHAILLTDMSMYASGEKKDNITNFLNHIIFNFVEKSQVSVSAIARLKADELCQNLNLKNFTQAQQEEIRKAFESQQLKRNTGYENGVKLKFRLNKETFELIETKDDEIDKYGTLSLYLKAILEEYALLPNYKRERIFYAKTTNIIESALAHKTCLTITTHNPKHDPNKKFIKFRMKPYKMCTDETGTLNYLVGRTSELSDDYQAKEMKDSSIRLSNIINIAEATSYNGFLSKNTQEILDKMVLNPSEQTSEGTCKVRVKFDDEGLRLLRSIAHNKPHNLKPSDDDKYVYECMTSEFRAEHYFWKFQQHVEILEPESLRKKFKETISQTSKIYNS